LPENGDALRQKGRCFSLHVLHALHGEKLLREKGGRLRRRGETMKDMKSMKALKGVSLWLRGSLFGVHVSSKAPNDSKLAAIASQLASCDSQLASNDSKPDAIASKLAAIASKLDTIVSKLDVVASKLDVIAYQLDTIVFKLAVNVIKIAAFVIKPAVNVIKFGANVIKHDRKVPAFVDDGTVSPFSDAFFRLPDAVCTPRFFIFRPNGRFSAANSLSSTCQKYTHHTT
jgi:hypothetical protein